MVNFPCGKTQRVPLNVLITALCHAILSLNISSDWFVKANFPLRKLQFSRPQRGFVPAQTKKKEKIGQFSGSKPSGLSPQRALF
jgi:hypothetical protein